MLLLQARGEPIQLTTAISNSNVRERDAIVGPHNAAIGNCRGSQGGSRQHRSDFNNKKTGNWSGYYHFDDGTSTIPGTFGAAYGNFGQGNYTRAQQGVLTNTRVLGPSTVNEFRLDYTRNAAHADVPTDQPVSLSSLGFVTGANTLGIVSSTPYDSVPNMGLVNFSFGRNAQQNQGKYENTYHIGDGLSKTVGSHAFKFGGSFLYMQVNERNVYAPSGSFSFDGSETGSDIADFLLGAPASYTQASFQLLDSRTKYGSVYAQDSWRIKPNLTINYGVRWEASMPWYDTQNKIETIVPGQQSTVFPGAPPGWVFPRRQRHSHHAGANQVGRFLSALRDCLVAR